MLSNSFLETGQGLVSNRHVLNAAYLLDEAGKGERQSFTGNFVGMIAFETLGLAAEAQFLRFSYTDVPSTLKKSVQPLCLNTLI